MYTLAQLEEAIRRSWGPDTVDPDDGWSEDNPAQGQCDVTCLVVNDLIGGELAAAQVFLGGRRVMAHMWNRLPSGIEVDLTREQFTNGEVLGPARFIQRPPDSLLAGASPPPPLPAVPGTRGARDGPAPSRRDGSVRAPSRVTFPARDDTSPRRLCP